MKLIAVAAMVLSTTAVAQPDKDWWACQEVHSSGMYWENNRWMTATFQEGSPFVLMSDGNGSLTKESVLKAVDNASLQKSEVECKAWGYEGRVSCMTVMGGHLYFSKETGKGGISAMLGSTMSDTNFRGTIRVHAFECTKG